MNNKKILVHLHLYYQDQTDYMIEKLRNITDCNWDLFLTYCTLDNIQRQKFLKLKHDTHFIQVENRGYDVLPFINVIKSVNLNEYDYVLKIHTKNKQKKFWVGEYNTSGYWWRNQLINPLLKTKKQFIKNLKILDNKPQIGMLFSEILCWKLGNSLPEDTFLLEEELKYLNFKSNYQYYCAGTMFFARSNIFKFLQNVDIDNNRFELSKETKTISTLAHVYERILTIAVDEYGYNIYTVKNNFEKYKRLLQNFISQIFSIKNKKENGIKIKQITVLGYKFYINKGNK